MLCFRSEADVDAWCARRALGRGAVLSFALTWMLARAWYRERASPGWRGRTPEAAQAVFESVGLTGEFWRMGPST